MGFSYSNITLQINDQQAVAQYLNILHWNALVLPPTKGFVIVCADETEASDQTDLRTSLTNQLSRHFECASIFVTVFDDDILWYQLHQNGNFLDEYDSNPDYFEAAEHRGPIGGDANIICKVFNRPKNVAKVENILRAPHGEGYIFEHDRHSDLAKALGWFGGYYFLDYGELARFDDGYIGTDDFSLFAKPLSRRWLKEFTEPDVRSSSFDLDKEILKLLRRKKKISAIILCQQHKMCALTEARSYVDELEKRIR